MPCVSSTSLVLPTSAPPSMEKSMCVTLEPALAAFLIRVSYSDTIERPNSLITPLAALSRGPGPLSCPSFPRFLGMQKFTMLERSLAPHKKGVAMLTVVFFTPITPVDATFRQDAKAALKEKKKRRKEAISHL